MFKNGIDKIIKKAQLPHDIRSKRECDFYP